MYFSEDFDLDALVAEEKALIVKPQIRFLWQHKEFLESYLKKASERFGVSFEFGLEGICLHPWCHAETERHKLTVTPTYARVDYPSFAGPEKGLDFYFDQLCVAPDGRMFVPCGTWRWKEGNWRNDEKD